VTAAKEPTPPPAEKITLDDVKHRAEAVKDLAVTDTKAALHKVVADDAVKTLLLVAGTVVVVASLAFMLGASSQRGSRPPAPPVL